MNYRETTSRVMTNRVKNAITGYLRRAAAVNYRETAYRVKNAITAVNYRETAYRVKNAIAGNLRRAAAVDYRETAYRVKNAITAVNYRETAKDVIAAVVIAVVNYRETASRVKNAITGNLRRTAIVGAAIAVTGLVAAPVMSFAPQTPSAAPAVAAAYGESADQAVPASAKGSSKSISKADTKAATRKAPSQREMNPQKITMHQTTYKPNRSQMSNARKIIAEGQRRHLPPRAWVIALATSAQETNLNNYGWLKNNDHDSLGLFQQRPSSGWGKPKDLVNPQYSAGKFYNALVQVHNWKSLPVTVAAQRVQVSAFPDRYAQWEKHATNLILATYGQGPYANVPGAHG